MARSVAISPRRSFTVMVSRVRDQQHGDDQAHAAEDVGELPEVDEALAEVRHQVGDAVHLELGECAPEAARRAPATCSSSRAFTRMSEARSLGVLAGEPLHDRQHGADRRLAAVVVEPAAPSRARPGGGPRAAVTTCGSSRPTSVTVSPTRARRGALAAGRAEQTRRRCRRARGRGPAVTLVERLRLGLERRSRRASPVESAVRAVERGPQDRAGRRDRGVATGALATMPDAPAIVASVSNGRVPLGVSRIW